MKWNETGLFVCFICETGEFFFIKVGQKERGFFNLIFFYSFLKSSEFFLMCENERVFSSPVEIFLYKLQSEVKKKAKSAKAISI